MIEGIPALLPLHFFEISFEAKYLPSRKKRGRLTKEFLVAPTGKLLGEEALKEFFFAWNEKGNQGHCCAARNV